MGQIPMETEEPRPNVTVVRVLGVWSDAQYAEYLVWLTELVAGGARRVLVIDLVRAGRMPPSQRALQAQWTKTNWDLLAKNVAGMVFIITNPLVRGALQAILWVQSMPMKHVVMGSVGQALQWADRALSGDAALPRSEP